MTCLGLLQMMGKRPRISSVENNHRFELSIYVTMVHYLSRQRSAGIAISAKSTNEKSLKVKVSLRHHDSAMAAVSSHAGAVNGFSPSHRLRMLSPHCKSMGVEYLIVES